MNSLKKIKETISFTIVSKKKKPKLPTNLTKDVKNLYNEISKELNNV
jgi:hypothetical protein